MKIGYDGRVHKYFRGPKAEERFANEVLVLRYLESRQCPFVPRLLDSNADELSIVTSNVGSIVERITDERAAEVFAELEEFGVRHDDPFARNITYRSSDGRFCVIDFEFATILEGGWQRESAVAEAQDADERIELAWSGWTDRGKFRSNNEDAFLLLRLDERGIQYLGKNGQASLQDAEFIFAVSDGMGGENSGELASRIALEKITLRLPREFHSPGPDDAREYGQQHCEEVLAELFASIHEAMLYLGRYDANCRDMGATLTLAWFRHSQLYFAHIGDSRLYQVRDGELRQISEDHTHVGWLRRSGKINERQARSHPRKNALNQALGAGHQFLKPHIGYMRYQSGDKILICSDGITEALWDSRIERELESVEVGASAERLVSKSVLESGRDNATAVVIGLTEEFQ